MIQKEAEREYKYVFYDTLRWITKLVNGKMKTSITSLRYRNTEKESGKPQNGGIYHKTERDTYIKEEENKSINTSFTMHRKNTATKQLLTCMIQGK